MAGRGEDAEGLPGERQLGASNAAGSLYMPWQTLSALAAETGQAVKQTFTDSGVGTGGHVQQSAQKSYSSSQGYGTRDPSYQPEVPSNGDPVSDAQWKAKSSPDQDFVDPDAVQADVRTVRRKMLSTDAATEVVLRFNFLSGPESRAALLLVVFSILIGAGVLITEFVHKMEVVGSKAVCYNCVHPGYTCPPQHPKTSPLHTKCKPSFLQLMQGNQPFPLRHKTTFIWNVAVGGVCLILVTLSLGNLVWNTLDAVRLRKHWKHRQKRNVQLIILEGLLQWLNLVFYMVPNILMVVSTCYIFKDLWFWLGFARWTCWNCIFMLFLVHAYSTLTWKRQESDNISVSAAAMEHGFQSPEGHSKLVMDGPWYLLWPCLLIWPFFEAVMGFGFIHNAEISTHADYVFGLCKNPEYFSLLTTAKCSVDKATTIMVDFIVAFALLYFLVTYVLLLIRLKGYRKQAYTSVQVGLVYNTLQLWLRMAVMTFFTLCLVLLWLIGPGWCVSEEFSWLGLMPMQIVMSANTVVLCYIATPITPQEHVAASAVWLQEFAWTEGDKPVKLEARSIMVPDNAKLKHEPIFCFETMMNLLYWSCFVYDHKKEPETPRNGNGVATPGDGVTKPSPGQQEKLQGTSFSASTTLNLETAMSLYKLTESQSFWEVQQDTRCLMGWGSNTVVVAFRGTASMKNALADVQAWRIAHPPIRGQTLLGTRPLVHVGFLKSWLAGGLKLKVVNHVLEAVRQCKEQSKSDQPVTVFVTGHSLGGALATLAAYDIRKQLQDNNQSHTKVVCYTFAAPRTGNHAFAREYNAMVPDTWSVINDQDVVTREGKMLFLYKRPGQRVILNAAGHMMVRPTHMETSVQKSAGGQSVRHHMLTNYFHAILSVVLAQFTGLGFIDGMEGVVRLAEASPYIRDLLETQMGMSLPEMAAFCQADPANRKSQSLPRAHLPSKGFWIVKRPSGPSTAAAPSIGDRLRRKISKNTLADPALRRTSNGQMQGEEEA